MSTSIKHLIFADESGTDSSHRCYTIGAIKTNNIQLDLLINEFDKLYKECGIVGEVKWKKVGSSGGIGRFALRLFQYIILNEIEISFIVVKKDVFRAWNNDKESGFYMTYNYLLRHILKVEKGNCHVFIDNRTDSYKKQNEVMEIITNNMLGQLNAESNINKVEKSDSKTYKAIQIIDLFTGAINASTNLFLDPMFKNNTGKKTFIKELSNMLGWDALHYDTWPNNYINIWHFPIEFRNFPKTKNIEINEKFVVKI